MVAGGTSDLGFHHKLLFQLETEFRGGFYAELRVVGDVGFRIITEIINFLQWTQILFRCTVTLEAPPHRMRLGLVDDLHLVHIAMAALTRNPPVNVRGVVKIDVVRRFVDSYPLDGLTIVAGIVHIHRLMQRS